MLAVIAANIYERTLQAKFRCSSIGLFSPVCSRALWRYRLRALFAFARVDRHCKLREKPISQSRKHPSSWLCRLRYIAAYTHFSYAATFKSASRSARRKILPTFVFGKSVLKTTYFGIL